MKNLLNKSKLLLLIFSVIMLTSCEENENVTFDPTNLDNGLAGFLPGNFLTFNPADNVDNEILVGVSTVSDVDRSFTVSLDLSSSLTLPDTYYEVPTFTGVIPAGSFSGSVIVRTLGPTNPILPEPNNRLDIVLESLDGADLVEGSILEVELPIVVACPDPLVEADLVGQWQITIDPFVTCLGNCQFEIVAGPGPNQVTALDIFNHPNPAGGVYDVVFDVNYDTGNISVAAQDAWHCVNFGCSFGQATVETEGPATAFNCIGNGNLKFVFRHRVAAGTFGAFAMEMDKL